MNINMHFLYLPHFISECKMFQREVVEELQTRIMYVQYFFFSKSCRLSDNVEKLRCAGQATDDNMAHAHCMVNT